MFVISAMSEKESSLGSLRDVTLVFSTVPSKNSLFSFNRLAKFTITMDKNRQNSIHVKILNVPH